MGHPAHAHAIAIVTLTEQQLGELLTEAAQRGAMQALALAKAAAAPPGQLVNRKAMAQLLGVSTPTLDRFVLRGMPYVRVGAHRKYDQQKVRAWLDQHGTEARVTNERGAAAE